jgi:hypothetical protein
MTLPSTNEEEMASEVRRLATILGISAPERIEDLADRLRGMQTLRRTFGTFNDLPSPSTIIKTQYAYQSSLRRMLAAIPEPKPFGSGQQTVSPHFLYALGQELAPDEPSDEVMLTTAIAELADIRHRIQRLIRAAERAAADAGREQLPASDKDRHQEPRGPKYAFEHAINVFHSLTNRYPWVGTDDVGNVATEGDVEVLRTFLELMGLRLTPAGIRQRLRRQDVMGPSTKHPRKRSASSGPDQV